MQTGHASVFGGASWYSEPQPQNILLFVSNCAWTSSPITTSYFMA